MIKSRKELLAINPGFTKFILDLQLLDRQESFEEGESIFLEFEDEIQQIN